MLCGKEFTPLQKEVWPLLSGFQELISKSLGCHLHRTVSVLSQQCDWGWGTFESTADGLESEVNHLGSGCAVCQSLSCVQLFMTPWPGAHQSPLSMGFSRQEYWSGLPLPSPGDLPNPGIKPPTLQADSLPSEPPEKPRCNKAPKKPRTPQLGWPSWSAPLWVCSHMQC